MVGFGKDLDQIKERLARSSTRREIVSIVGMGGIGKTTLAKNIYNDSYIKHHFHIRAWTTVSQQYDVGALLADLLKSMEELTAEMKQKETGDLKQKLYQSLKGKRFLIVMDDVWDINVWNEIGRLFPDDNNGSRIIFTTRSSDVAVKIDSSSLIHHLNFLSPEQSWSLLSQKAFGEEHCLPELEKTGKTIAKKCKGLPLALVAIGGLLYKAEKTPTFWEYVAKNLKSATRDYDDFMEILSWSYKHLPHHLRACFLYMGIFPEDYVIHVSYLIQLWVSEGFFKPTTPESMEEVAKDYLKDLIDRNLIMVCDRSYNGEIKTCSVHDLIRELCMREARKEKFFHVMNQDDKIPSGIIKNQRRLSIQREMLYDFVDMYDSTVRSLLCFTGGLSLIDLCFQKLKVLDACNTIFDNFPVEIVDLVHLRHIALVCKWVRKIPASISKLCNLQTLIVFQSSFDGDGILYLPSEIWEMPRLRHLLFERAFLPDPYGAQNGNLQTLSGIIGFRCTKEALQRIPNLKKLGISFQYESLSELSSYCVENLVNLHQLENLKCHFINKSLIGENFVPVSESVNLAFPPNLKKLTLSGCTISWENISIVGSLPNLEVLKLKDYSVTGTTWKTNDGEFAKLMFLLIEKNYLEFWEAEKEHFPHLQCLSLSGCLKLECIPSGIGEIPTLQVIILRECSLSVETSASLIQEEQRDFGNDDLQVHVYSHQDKFIASSGTSFREMYKSHAIRSRAFAWVSSVLFGLLLIMLSPLYLCFCTFSSWLKLVDMQHIIR